MKKPNKTALLTLGAMIVAPGAFAAAGDLILGFNGYSTGSPASPTDYLANLGSISTFTINDNLSAALTGAVPSYSLSLNVGAISQTQTGSGLTLTSTLFTTTLRIGGGSYTTPGSESGPDALVTSRANGNGAAASVAGLTLGAQDSGGAGSWSSTISLAPSTGGSGNNSFVNYLYGGGASGSVSPQNSPMVNFGASPLIVEDLWKATDSTGNGTWSYAGDLTIDLSGASPVVIYDAVAPVPEPSTFGILAGAGVLALLCRRQFIRNIA